MTTPSASVPAVAASLSFILALAGMGCGGNVGSFTFTEESEETTVEKGPGTPVDLPIFDNPFQSVSFEQELDQELQKRNADGAKAVYLEGFALRVTDKARDGDEEDYDLDFINSLELRVDTEGEDEELIAWNRSFPKDEERVELEVDNSVDLKPYVEKGLNWTADVDANQPEDHDVSIQAVVTLRVKVL